MTNEEAIKLMRSIRRTPANWILEYEAIDKAIECIEKQIPKKPTYCRVIGKCEDGRDLYSSEGYPMCPVCGEQIEKGRRCNNNECGQAIDWSEQ